MDIGDKLILLCVPGSYSNVVEVVSSYIILFRGLRNK